MTRLLTGFLAALTEAWGEIRVNRTRVVLSLVGVFPAVFAMTTITAAGNIGRQLLSESTERVQGRPATLRIDAYPEGASDAAALTQVRDAFRAAAERHEVTWWGFSSNGTAGTMTVRFAAGAQQVAFNTVDPAYGAMHRAQVTSGRFFTVADEDAFAPRLVVNQAFADLVGGFSGEPVTVQLGGPRPVTATIVGVMEVPYTGSSTPGAYALSSAAQEWALAGVDGANSPPGMEWWVPDADADQLLTLVRDELQEGLPGFSVSAYRSDAGEELGIFALVLGGVGVLNVGIVTVRQRIREIGVRRSFGATGGRVFFAVLLESVAATFLAGSLAVMASIVLVSNVPLDAILPAGSGLDDAPTFPVSAAVEGLVSATVIGALAGLVPATMAVRARVIDAIRY